MSVIVKCMDMPKTCYDCIAEVADDDILSFYCPFIYKGYTDKYRDNGRHPDCPLIEVEDGKDGEKQ